MDPVQPLKEKLRKNTFNYELLLRSDFKALYKQSDGNIQIGYEVFKIRIRETRFHPIANKVITAKEKFPSNDDFGKTAWSYKRLEDAMKKYNSIKE